MYLYTPPRIPNIANSVASTRLVTQTDILGCQAMGLILTGSPTTASEMERFGIVHLVCSAEEDVLDEALKLAATVASFSAPAVALAKQAVQTGRYPIVLKFSESCGLIWRS
jgi:enoyl-CoA hydratase/carnithine racemase